jgi:hypothetical protein
MNQFSDSESQDSDEGIRFKTDSIRNKQDRKILSSSKTYSRSRSRSPKNRGEDRSRRRHSERYRRERRRSSSRHSSRRRDDKPRSVHSEEFRVVSTNSEPEKRERRRSPAGDGSSPPRGTSDDSKNSQVTSRSAIGPALPPNLATKSTNSDQSTVSDRDGRSSKTSDANEEFKDGLVSPRLKEPTAIGPALPPHLSSKPTNSDQCIGPQLPPHLLKTTGESSIGPQLPPHLLRKEEPTDSSRIGPELPPHLRQQPENEESDEDVYGPLPADTVHQSKAQIALEERALLLKMDQLEPNKDKAKVREEWMLELPEVKAANFGLGPRQFRSKAGPDLSDRSSWTDTPDKKEKKGEKVDLKKDAERKEVKRRDEEQERMAKRHKKSKESLLEMHQSDMKKKKKVCEVIGFFVVFH